MIRDETAFLHMTGQGISCAYHLSQFMKKMISRILITSGNMGFQKCPFFFDSNSSEADFGHVLTKNFKGILCMLSNISSLQIFFSITFIKIIFLDNISVSNRLDLNQPRRSDLGPNCLRRQY